MRDASGTIFLALSFYYIKEYKGRTWLTIEILQKPSFLAKIGIEFESFGLLLRFGIEFKLNLNCTVPELKLAVFGLWSPEANYRKNEENSIFGANMLKYVILYSLVLSSH